jgi:hypothetical protein
MNNVAVVERGDNTPLTWGLVILVGVSDRDVMDTLAAWTVGDDSDVSDL